MEEEEVAWWHQASLVVACSQAPGATMVPPGAIAASTRSPVVMAASTRVYGLAWLHYVSPGPATVAPGCTSTMVLQCHQHQHQHHDQCR